MYVYFINKEKNDIEILRTPLKECLLKFINPYHKDRLDLGSIPEEGSSSSRR